MSLSERTPGNAAPHLRRQGHATQLIVDGAPFLVLGGELHNSSSSDLAYMQPIWERLVALGLNTVLAAVSWELVAPEEGRFEWTLVDGLIVEARPARPAPDPALVWLVEERTVDLCPHVAQARQSPLSACPPPGWERHRGLVHLFGSEP